MNSFCSSLDEALLCILCYLIVGWFLITIFCWHCSHCFIITSSKNFTGCSVLTGNLTWKHNTHVANTRGYKLKDPITRILWIHRHLQSQLSWLTGLCHVFVWGNEVCSSCSRFWKTCQNISLPSMNHNSACLSKDSFELIAWQKLLMYEQGSHIFTIYNPIRHRG